MSEHVEFIQGTAGRIECFVSLPTQEITGIAIVCHPHPLQGGNAHHKVPVLLAQIFNELGCVVYRPSFRGAGQSDGEHDNGVGETQDMLAVIEHLKQTYPNLPFYAGGFSFGAFVMAKCHDILGEQHRAKKLILCGLPTADVNVAGLRHYKTPAINGDFLLVHGEQDDITLLSDLIAWAAPQKHPITILPAANHFFTGHLKPLKTVIYRFLGMNS
ncbi:MAG: alpha/beta hydrolase [Acinetobacter sp.]|nr:alpha/beta hydrolase [Acinetobacter sp.]